MLFFFPVHTVTLGECLHGEKTFLKLRIQQFLLDNGRSKAPDSKISFFFIFFCFEISLILEAIPHTEIQWCVASHSLQSITDREGNLSQRETGGGEQTIGMKELRKEDGKKYGSVRRFLVVEPFHIRCI